MTEQLTIDAALARSTDPWTSHAAARSIQPEKLRASQQAVLECFQYIGGATNHNRLALYYNDLARRNGWPQQSESGLRSRTKELVNMGKLRNSGFTVTLDSGRKSILWELV